LSKQTKIIQTVSQPSDLDKISELTQGIIGKMCWSARLGYGDELKLDIGKRMPRKFGRVRGEWYLGSRATGWVLRYKDEIVLTSDSEAEAINREIKVIEQSPIVAFEALYPSLGLAMTFANEYVLSINPKKKMTIMKMSPIGNCLRHTK
jgi:hypothetical protein